MKEQLEPITFEEFAALYCETQDCEPARLREVLAGQVERFHPDGWVLLECALMDSSKLGERTILPFGPNNTFKSVPDRPVSPRGLASDMAVVRAVMLVEGIG